MLFQAIQFAISAHEGQKRLYSGDPYIRHPLRVMARALLLPGVTEAIAAAAVLHDVVEDCAVTLERIDELFGPEVASLVRELTNVSKETHPTANRKERKKLDRMRLASASGSAKRLKLIDRIDNLREMPDSASFARTYRAESRELLETLRGVDPALESELAGLTREVAED